MMFSFNNSETALVLLCFRSRVLKQQRFYRFKENYFTPIVFSELAKRRRKSAKTPARNRKSTNTLCVWQAKFCLLLQIIVFSVFRFCGCFLCSYQFHIVFISFFSLCSLTRVISLKHHKHNENETK